MLVTDPRPGEPSDATDGHGPKRSDGREPGNVDSDNDPHSPSETRKMQAALDDFFRSNRLRRSGLRRSERGSVGPVDRNQRWPTACTPGGSQRQGYDAGKPDPVSWTDGTQVSPRASYYAS
jgi:hypothetical protein